MDRRDFFKATALSLLASACPRVFAEGGKAASILMVSGWQSVNIGDIAHTIGLIQTFKKFLPEAKLTLWKVKPDAEVEAMISRHFPDVEIITTALKRDLSPTDGRLAEAAKKCDILVHASGPSVVARRHICAWRKICPKPYGIFGVTIDKIDEPLKDILQNAAFVFTRETASLENLKEAGIDRPVCAFVPDATFAFDVRDDAKADAFFESHKNVLAPGKFVCFIPRLRYTPYWKANKKRYSPEEISRREAVNARCEPVDSAKMRDAIEWLCRNTDLNALLCPEMTYQQELCKTALYEPLKSKFADRLVVRGYWMPDEAASVYARAAALFSFECHSPILALRQGTPAAYLRQPEDTIKGQMYYDLPLTQWVFEIENTDSTKIISALSDILKKPELARSRVSAANAAADALLKKGALITGQKARPQKGAPA